MNDQLIEGVPVDPSVHGVWLWGLTDLDLPVTMVH